ncbi:MAG: hypothetical protein ABSG41_17940 [Bryobacteraceae bacterium]|jgi:hypothetical protein
MALSESTAAATGIELSWTDSGGKLTRHLEYWDGISPADSDSSRFTSCMAGLTRTGAAAGVAALACEALFREQPVPAARTTTNKNKYPGRVELPENIWFEIIMRDGLKIPPK